MKKKRVLIWVISIIAINLCIGCDVEPWRIQNKDYSEGNSLLVMKIPKFIKEQVGKILKN